MNALFTAIVVYTLGCGPVNTRIVSKEAFEFAHQLGLQTRVIVFCFQTIRNMPDRWRIATTPNNYSLM